MHPFHRKPIRLMSKPDILHCDVHTRNLRLNVLDVPHMRRRILLACFIIQRVTLRMVSIVWDQESDECAREWIVKRDSAGRLGPATCLSLIPCWDTQRSILEDATPAPTLHEKENTI